MKLLWWKIYFWLNVVLFGLILFVQFVEPYMPAGPFIGEGVLFVVSIVGLYSYLFKQPLFDVRFWKYFFWFNIAYLVLFLLYCIFPDAPFLSNFSQFTYDAESNSLIGAIGAILFSAPLLYSNYQLSKGKYFLPKTKEQETKEVGTSKWGMIQTALWGYALVFIAIMLLLSFVPPSSSSGESGEFDFIYSALIFAPILLFWLWIVFEYKKYRWNWWRITLVLNSVLFSGLVVLGTVFYDPAAASTSENVDIISMLQFLIIFIGLYVFGREQFSKAVVTIPQDKMSSPT